MEPLESPLFSLFQIGTLIQNLNKQSEKQLGISLVQWCLLRQLIDMPATPAHILARAIRVHPSTLTQTLKRLEKRKHIFIAADPNDSRKKLISITRFGRDALENADPQIREVSSTLSTSSTDLRELSLLLVKTVKNRQSDLGFR